MSKPTLKFSKFDGSIAAGDMPEQTLTIDGEYMGWLSAYCDDFGSGMGHEYKVTGYRVEPLWRSTDSDAVGFDVKRNCHGDAKPGAARAALKGTKDLARAEWKQICAIAKAITKAVSA